ncbi:MAG: alanine dehydrogenase [Cytophagales bacterium]|nr:alanine dehydrogenase [Cytophagales bacterium]MDW8383714.1 alanine dehydrogenase [Flammeovirgaceae bacterium]
MAKKEISKGITEELLQIQPQEKLAEVKPKKSLVIGIPKEIARGERRVPLRPEAVHLLVNDGFEILVETGAGNSCKHQDKEYSDAGARIVYSPKEVFECPIILKIAPPSFEEIEMMKHGTTLISTMQINSMTADYLHAINRKNITAIGFGLIEDKVGGLPLVRAMSEIAGSTVMLIAAELLSSVHDGKGVILGGVTGVPPTSVVIIGAGTVAEFAARTALGLGAELKVFDNHLYRLRRIKEHLGQQIYTSTIDNITLREALQRADVVIGAMRPENGRTPIVVTEEMVASMKPNSVIIDVSIDHGGCFETSEATTHINPVYRKYEVIHYCVPNIPSRVARTATTAISNILTPILRDVAELGGIEEMIYNKSWFAKGVYAYRGKITNEGLAKQFGLPYKSLELLIAARFAQK